MSSDDEPKIGPQLAGLQDVATLDGVSGVKLRDCAVEPERQAMQSVLDRIRRTRHLQPGAIAAVKAEPVNAFCVIASAASGTTRTGRFALPSI